MRNIARFGRFECTVNSTFNECVIGYIQSFLTKKLSQIQLLKEGLILLWTWYHKGCWSGHGIIGVVCEGGGDVASTKPSIVMNLLRTGALPLHGKEYVRKQDAPSAIFDFDQ